MSARATIERERRWALPAALAALAPLGLVVVSVVIRQSALGGAEGDAEQLRTIEENAGSLIASAIVAAVGLALMSLPLLYLFRAAQARSPAVKAGLVGFAVIGPLLFAAQAIAEAIAVTDVASDFVAQSDQSDDRAESMLEDSSGFETTQGLLIPAVLAMIIGMVYIPLQALRVGLLTRFFGTLGMALGASLIIVPQAALALVLWFGWLGLVILGRVPGGRPPAWDAGEAIPWPRPGEDEPEPSPGEESPESQAAKPDAPTGPPPRKRKRRS